LKLQIFLREAGVDSRRKVMRFIEEGRVTVNGKAVSVPYEQVDPVKDKIFLDEKKLFIQKKVYIMLNKPAGLVSTKSDERGRKTVFDIFKDTDYNLHYAGRLDRDTEGLLIMTNDGDFSRWITSPSSKVNKKYFIKVLGLFDDAHKKKIEKGVFLDGRKRYPSSIKIIKKSNKYSLLEMVIMEGKKRQVKRMMKYTGFHVAYLKRLEIGTLALGSLKPGEWRFLRDSEVKSLKPSYLNI